MDEQLIPLDYDPFAQDTAALPPAEPLAAPSLPLAPVPSPAPAGSPPASNVPPRQPAAAPAQDLVPLDYDPFAPQAPAYQPSSDTAITRGFKVGREGGTKAFTAVADLHRISALPPEQQVAELLKEKPVDPAAARMQVPGVENISGVNDFLTYVGENVGQMAGSMFSAAETGGLAGAGAGALVGGAAGATAMGVGALPGAVAGSVAGGTYGTAGAFVAQGIGGMYQDLLSDPGVRKGLQDGTVTPDQIFKWSVGAGSLIGMIDVVPEARLAEKFGLIGHLGKEQVKKTVLKALTKGAVHQAGTEGGTEALQGAISEFGQAVVGGDVNASQRALSIINQGLAGAIGGAGPGAAGGVVENARIPTQPGVTTPAPAAAVGQPTPGGTGVTAPPPAGVSSAEAGAPPPAAASPEAKAPGVVSVVPKGGVDPALEATVASAAPDALSAPRPVPGAAAAVPTTAVASAPVVDEENVYDPTPTADETAADLASLTEAQNAIRDMLKAREVAANATAPATPNSDITAALTPAPTTPTQQTPQALPPQPTPAALPALGPEPPGTAGAASRQPGPVTEGVPTAPTPFDNGLVAPAPTLPPVAQESVGAVSPQPSVPAQPVASFAPAPQAAPVALKLTPVSRALADRVRVELQSDPIQETPGFFDAVNQVAAEQVANLPRGIAPARAVEQRFADTISAVRTRLGQSQAEQAAREAQIAEAQQQRAIDTAKAKRLTGTPQEHARTGKEKTKTAEEILAESEQTTLRAAKAAPQDQDLADFAGLYAQRKEIKTGTHKEKAARRATLTAMMREAQARRAERIGRVEAPPAEAVKPGLTPEEAQTALEAKDAARKAAAIAKAKERGAKLDPAAKAAIASVQEPSWDRIPSMPRLATEARAYVKNVIDAVHTALKGVGEELGSRIDRNHSPAENLAIFGRQLLAGQHPGMDPSQFITAKILIDGGHLDDFFNLATNETLGGYQLENRGTAPEGQGGAYDEGANQFLPVMEPTRNTLQFQVRGGEPPVSVSVLRTTTSGEVLRSTLVEARSAGPQRRFIGLLQRMHAKALRQMVGDVPLVFVPSTDINNVFNVDATKQMVGGFYTNPSIVARYFAGEKPAIVINNDNWVLSGADARRRIIMHEMTHAATSLALKTNLRGTKQVISRLRIAFQRQVMKSGVDPATIYGLTNDDEFIAEAFSNTKFQEWLAASEVDPGIAEQIRGITKDLEAPTWWRAFVSTVQNALGWFGILGKERGTSYLESVIALHPAIMQSSAQQEQTVEQAIGEKIQRLATPQLYARHAFDVLPMSFDVLDSFDAVKGKAGFRWYNRASRWLSTRLATTSEMIRSSERLFGGATNPFKALAEEFLSGRAQREKYRKVGDDISVDLAAFQKASATQFAEFADIAYEATLAGVDPAAPLGAPSNKHISKKGLLDNHRRAAHARLAPRWSALTPDAKALWSRMADHYAAQEELRLSKLVRNIVDAATKKYGVTLPAGESTQSVVDWVMNGEVDRIAPEDPANLKTGEQTPRDVALHAALGKTSETLAGTRGMRKIKGTYIPLTRWGKYFFTATHKVDVPAGAILDPSAKDKNVLIFADKNDLKSYTASTDEQIDSVQSRYVDPSTGTKLTAKDANAKQIFLVTVQNRTLLMDDNQAALARQREDYLGGNFQTTSEVALIDTIMHGTQTVLPQQLNRLVNNVRQSTIGNVTVGQQANINAITDAYIRQLAGSRAAHRRLKRRNVAGFSKDLVQATLSSNHVMSGHLTQLDRAPKMAELDHALDQYVEGGRKGQYPSSAAGTDTLWRQEYVRELRNRIQSVTTRNDEAFGSRAANIGMDLSFMTHLFSPAYTIINLMQPLSTTHPMYAAQFGDGATTREMIRAYWDLGARKTLVRGVKETVREAQKVFSAAHRQFRHHEAVRALGAGIEHGNIFQEAMDKLEQLGLGSSSGIETADIHEIGRSKAEQAVGRAVRVARALPEAAEAINRYTTLLTGVRLAKRSGMTDAQAVDFAVTSVEKSQGGYAAENNPAFMSNKWLRLPLQFKKYPLMYGQLFYGNLARALNTSNDRATRVVAAKTVVRLSAMTIALAGTAGLPFMEIARSMLLVASGLGLNDEDWESWENGLQAWYGGAISWATGDKEIGATGAEVIARGASRLLGFDTSSRLGNDSMVMFGDPKTLDEQGTYAWLFGMAIGAPGGMATDVIKGIHNRDLSKAVPLPKFMRDAMKGYGQFMEGTKTSAGRQVADPISGLEAFWQGLGFRPASSARQWEVGGSGAASKEKKILMSERSKTMGAWSNALPRDRQKIWRTTIRDWNRAHKSKAEKIEYGDLQRSLARRKALAKQQ